MLGKWAVQNRINSKAI